MAKRHCRFESQPGFLRLGQPRGRPFLILLIVLASLACAPGPMPGPLFTAAPPPGPGLARVYLYRIDPHHSFSEVEIRFDGRRPLHLLDEEYVTLELTEGTHELEFRLHSKFGWPIFGWRQQRARAQQGETIYFEIGVGVVEQPIPTGRDLAIAGRDAGTAGEVVSIRVRSESEAMQALRNTHLHNR